ncbi:hypothetical protein LWI29_017553 [Acer saccharum]|uniref:Integrase catalytic domain-containing protein n=1 Tax=Acer saccharum TaxID=4024 RepID=A0AA39T3X5_ACESA|nr:hypothetical protein LWI29_017553 [Acer saccharum]
MSSDQSNTQNNWILDTGASHHMTSDLQNLSLHSEYGGTKNIMVGDGKTIPISHTGFTSLNTPTTSFSLNHVLCSPHISQNLVSVSKFFTHNNTSIEFFPNYFIVKDLNTGASLVHGQNRGNLYVWPKSSLPCHSSAHQNFSSSQSTVSAKSWHCRLGHLALSVLQHLFSSHNLPVSKSEKNFSHCSACLCNKSHKLPFGTSTLSSNKPFEILCTDVWGPAHILSFDKFKYYVIFVDYYSKYTWLFPLKYKSEVSQVFKKFKLLVENFFNAKIKTVYSDGSGEAQTLGLELQNFGIQHLKSPPHTPEHVGTAERKHRHVVETALTLLHHASVPLKFWSLVFQTVVYLINRMPTKVLSHKSPYSLLFGSAPNYNKLRVFGCLCYPWLRPYTSHKLQPRSRPCVFVGYSNEHNACLCLDTATSRVFVSCHVVFVENIFPFSTTMNSAHSDPLLTATHWLHSSLPSDTSHRSTACSSDHVSTPLIDSFIADFIPIHMLSSHSPTSLLPTSVPHLLDQAPLTSSSHHTGPLSTQPPDTLPPHQSSSAHTNSGSAPLPLDPVIIPSSRQIHTKSKSHIFKPKAIFDLHATANSTPQTEPTNLSQARKFLEWRQAMSAEYDALVTNDTWKLVPSSSTQNVVGCKWIFRIKRHPDGSVARYKARLVAKGFNQRPGIDFTETYSPVVKPVTVRLILTFAVINGWPLRQLDVNNAFLQGSLTDDVYMEQPVGFVDASLPHHMCKLQKAIYGLRQAPHAWYNELRTFLLATGFLNSKCDASLFVRHRSG